ncbi:MAG TPA: twin-arginine translocation signal domain-containing protein, partial [Phycisphaerales bacterium]|nr:twin-arginine translocation signal domain-containing protein [Phycisphaerales bacterium]
MSSRTNAQAASTSRRQFLKTSGALAALAMADPVASRLYAGETNTIRVGLVGCGGRGTGAAVNALSTAGPTQLVAMGDVFDSRLKTSLEAISGQFADKVNVPPDCRFVGMDAYKKVVEVVGAGGVVLLATPPAFRPLHVEYAVEKGLNIFMEKSFAVDAPGIRRILKAGQEAEKKNLKIVGGLMSRHYPPLVQAVEQLHKGIIGEIVTCWAYREHGPVGFGPRPEGMSEMAHQIRNYSNFTWVNGSFILDWLIHNIDVCCWCKDAWPVSAQGQGGRQVRSYKDQLFDHYSVEYRFGDGTRLLAQGRHMDNCWGFFGDHIHGATGSAELGEGITNPRIFKGWQQRPEDIIWRYEGDRGSGYQVEHDLLFAAVRKNEALNETQR